MARAKIASALALDEKIPATLPSMLIATPRKEKLRDPLEPDRELARLVTEQRDLVGRQLPSYFGHLAHASMLGNRGLPRRVAAIAGSLLSSWQRNLPKFRKLSRLQIGRNGLQ